jgi:hypothetical protein
MLEISTGYTHWRQRRHELVWIHKTQTGDSRAQCGWPELKAVVDCEPQTKGVAHLTMPRASPVEAQPYQMVRCTSEQSYIREIR